MAVRSDVFIGVKVALSADMEWALKERFAAQILIHERGVAYVMQDVKWYGDDVDAIYAELAGRDIHDVIVVAACHDYPDSDEGDYGAWEDSPWQPCREISVSLNYEE